ncbi:hypothetical protein N825_23000 [Skermanella stibiiresistens SB22]|uniref:Uncharacterized protein n=1 Tax=Skermanella stibiiresistens SB22 TaxID=1385369 RepID=W9GZH7_9PROT|nr:hypothetical protein [Skermanella stibiiresistens]EWY36888.1 hypothetical protein N825_23000 [Skermanella stibiiresistens SB22]
MSIVTLSSNWIARPVPSAEMTPVAVLVIVTLSLALSPTASTELPVTERTVPELVKRVRVAAVAAFVPEVMVTDRAFLAVALDTVTPAAIDRSAFWPTVVPVVVELIAWAEAVAAPPNRAKRETVPRRYSLADVMTPRVIQLIGNAFKRHDRRGPCARIGVVFVTDLVDFYSSVAL